MKENLIIRVQINWGGGPKTSKTYEGVQINFGQGRGDQIMYSDFRGPGRGVTGWSVGVFLWPHPYSISRSPTYIEKMDDVSLLSLLVKDNVHKS